MGELPCLGLQVAERILQPQSLLQGQQAMLKASLTGAWLTSNEVLVIGHTVPIPLIRQGGYQLAGQAAGCRGRKVCALVYSTGA